MDLDVYTQVKVSVKRLLNIDLTAYKDEQMRRRLDSWLLRCGAATWEDYNRRLKDDPNELKRFRDYLTINVSEFFRDAERWATLRSTVLPHLLQSSGRSLRVWSAGCSIGPEPYSLAILLQEITPLTQHYLLATDLDRSALEKARQRGPFTAQEVKNVTPVQLQKHFEPGGPPHFVKPGLASKIQFREQNMLNDPFETGFDLILCRNVIIYFTAEAKAGLYQKFVNALRPGGVLFLGGTEIIPHPQTIGLSNLGICFYLKKA
jgi:chemotaxis protein methyltransferase CheR